jgi:hypothetical protein
VAAGTFVRPNPYRSGEWFIDPTLAGGLKPATDPANLTEAGGAIGGTSDGDLPALVDPNGDAGATVIAGIRENATKINAILAALRAGGFIV